MNEIFSSKHSKAEDPEDVFLNKQSNVSDNKDPFSVFGTQSSNPEAGSGKKSMQVENKFDPFNLDFPSNTSGKGESEKVINSLFENNQESKFALLSPNTSVNQGNKFKDRHMSLLSDMSPGGLKDSGETAQSSNVPKGRMERSFKDQDNVRLGQQKREFQLKLKKKKKLRRLDISKKERVKEEVKWISGGFEDSENSI